VKEGKTVRNTSENVDQRGLIQRFLVKLERSVAIEEELLSNELSVIQERTTK